MSWEQIRQDLEDAWYSYTQMMIHRGAQSARQPEQEDESTADDQPPKWAKPLAPPPRWK